MNLSEKITIVIPCKNEEYYINNILSSLLLQKIGNTRIIIADCSTDNTREIISKNKAHLNIEIVEGGPVSIARNNAAKLVTTPYILFIDADVILFDRYTIRDAVFELEHNDLDLVGAKIKCYDGDTKAQISFSIFNFVNSILKFWTPFAVGAFMLTRTEKFWKFGGFDTKYSTSEDFFLSKKFDTKKFKILDHYFGQDSRRFKKMGYFGMAWYLVKNFINRNNPRYWNSLEHSKYWSK